MVKGSLNKDSQFAQCRNWREQSHDCQVVYQNLSVGLKLITLKESSIAPKYNRLPLVSALWLFCSWTFPGCSSVLCSAALLSISAPALPQPPPLATVPCTALSSNLTTIYLQVIITPSPLCGKSAFPSEKKSFYTVVGRTVCLVLNMIWPVRSLVSIPFSIHHFLAPSENK